MKMNSIPQELSKYSVVLEPDENIPEWWAGAPSVVLVSDGAFYLAARMREGNSPRGKRGYEVRILKSADGIRFTPIKHLTREDAGLVGFERPALVVNPQTGKVALFGCTPVDGGWTIIRWGDVDNPADFAAKTARPVLGVEPSSDGFARVTGYKDPVVFCDEELWHMFVIGCDYVERIHHFVSDDGWTWRAGTPAPILENTGWHNFYTRPASVLPMAVGYLFIYEGSSVFWRDPVYNIATGLAYTADLRHFVDLTPNEPLLTSTTPGDYHTWRYSHWMRVGDKIHAYFEAARPNSTNEIRVGILRADGLL